jgi:uncharacterized protein YndB with AHSA1/START domain
MITADVDLQINCPPDEVFDVWADTRNENDWNPSATGFEKTTSGPIGPGAIFKGAVKGMGMVTVEIVDFERPRKVEHRGSAQAFRFASTVILSPTAAGTHLHAQGQVEPRGVYKLMTPIMRPLMQMKFTATMASFKRAVEARPRENPPNPHGVSRRA